MLYAILKEDFSIRELRDLTILPPHKEGRVVPVVFDSEPPYNSNNQQLTWGIPIYRPESSDVFISWVVIPITSPRRMDRVLNALINFFSLFSNPQKEQLASNITVAYILITLREFATAKRILTNLVVPTEFETAKQELLVKFNGA